MTTPDTQPKRPAQMPPPEWLAPIDTSNLVSPEVQDTPPGRCLLSLVVMALTSCMCVFVISLSVIAGVRDEQQAIQTDEFREAATENSAQYALAMENLERGQYELAYDRLEWIMTREPNFRDVEVRLQELSVALSVTPTPQATDTPAPTVTPTPSPSPAVTSTPTVPPIEQYFADAEKYFDFGYYEDAIEWLDVVIATDPTYRQAEVQRMLFTALIEQANRYFRGVNPLDETGQMGLPGNQLSRGITLTDRALELQAANPSVGNYDQIPHYTRNFVERFLRAQALLDNREYQQAYVILDALCAENCNWEYRGVSVRSLHERAANGY